MTQQSSSLAITAANTAIDPELCAQITPFLDQVFADTKLDDLDGMAMHICMAHIDEALKRARAIASGEIAFSERTTKVLELLADIAVLEPEGKLRVTRMPIGDDQITRLFKITDQLMP